MNNKQSLYSLIHGDEKIYSDLNVDGLKTVMYGAGDDYSELDKLIKEIRPKRILEIGSWLDYSSIHMAKFIKTKKMNTGLLCLDTWLGEKGMIGMKFNGKRFMNGMSVAYKHFLANVKMEGVDDVIVPFPQTSKNGLSFLSEKGVSFDMIHMKGSKDYEEIKSNLQLSWSILSNGGVLFGNNYLNFSMPQVNAAINSFVYENRMRDCLSIDENNHFWFIKKKDLA